MRMKGCLLFLTVVIIGLAGCNGNSNQKKSRLFIVQEVQLDDGRSLFWFREEQQGTHEGVNYFQITNDKCELSVDKAHAYCMSPVQIYHFFGDTIYILTHTSLEIMRSDSWFTLKAVPYSPELYDSNKNPDPKKQFFLDSPCSHK